VKKYLTGKGTAGKDEVMMAVARRFAWFDGDNNEADALGLAAATADHYGAPMVAMPALNRTALAAVTWPEFGTGAR
jgi:Holliday junction resolvasome RuvABC endonuclease subunit